MGDAGPAGAETLTSHSGLLSVPFGAGVSQSGVQINGAED